MMEEVACKHTFLLIHAVIRIKHTNKNLPRVFYRDIFVKRVC